VRVTNGGWFVVNKATCSAGNTDFDMNCAMSINQPFNVRSYTARYTAPYNNGTAAMTVSKRSGRRKKKLAACMAPIEQPVVMKVSPS